MIGLDKTVFYHVEITDYDINYLRKLADGKQITVFPKDNEQGERLQRLELIDRELGVDLKYGSVKDRGREYWYTHMMLTTPEGKSNVEPKTTKELLEYYLPQIAAEILHRYRIKLDMSNIQYRQIEFNFTFMLSEPFQNYDKVFKYMQTNGTKYFKKENTPKAHKAGAVSSYYLANSSRSLKIYCKYQDKVEYCRIEYSLDKAKVIKNALGTNKVAEIEDTQLQQYFREQFKKDILIPCRRALKQQDKSIVKRMRQLPSKGVSEIIKFGWELDNESGILDIMQLYEAIKVVDKNNAYRSIKKVDSSMKLEYLRGNLKRFTEIEERVLKEAEIMIQQIDESSKEI